MKDAFLAPVSFVQSIQLVDRRCCVEISAEIPILIVAACSEEIVGLHSIVNLSLKGRLMGKLSGTNLRITEIIFEGQLS
jgi:hypothetical protein